MPTATTTEPATGHHTASRTTTKPTTIPTTELERSAARILSLEGVLVRGAGHMLHDRAGPPCPWPFPVSQA